MKFPADELSLDQLLLDEQNPRLPEHLQGGDQASILEWMYDHAVLEELLVSFLDHGYLDHEPLFVLASSTEHKWIVLEGNRRLAALMILTGQQAALDAEIQYTPVEEPSPRQLSALATIPVRKVATREDVRQFVGFRHIGGLKEWPPEAKARWIEDEIRRRRASNGNSNVFADIARSVGTNAQSVRGPYLALRILRQAMDELEDDDTTARYVQAHRFGVLVRATNSPDLRSHLAPEGPASLRTLSDIEDLVTALVTERLARVLRDMVPPPGRKTPVLADSRDVTTYARALQHPVASKALDDYGDLSLARQVLDRQDLPVRIRRLGDSVRVILEEIQRGFEPPPEGAHEAARQLLTATKSLEVQLGARMQDHL